MGNSVSFPYFKMINTTSVLSIYPLLIEATSPANGSTLTSVCRPVVFQSSSAENTFHCLTPQGSIRGDAALLRSFDP